MARASCRPSMVTSAVTARLLPLAQARAVAPSQLLDHLGADVVARAGVLLARIAQPERQQVGRPAPPGDHSEELSPSAAAASPPASPAAASPPASPRPRHLPLLALLGLLDDLGLRGQRGDDGHLGIVDQLHALGHRELARPDDVTDLHLADVVGEGARHVAGRGAHRDRVDSRVDQAALGQHGLGLALEVEGHGDLDDLVEAHDHEVEVGDVALHGSRWRDLTIVGCVVPSTSRWMSALSPAGPGEGVTQLPAVDGDAQRVHAVAVEHGGDLALGPQPAAGGCCPWCDRCER